MKLCAGRHISPRNNTMTHHHHHHLESGIEKDTSVHINKQTQAAMAKIFFKECGQAACQRCIQFI